MSTRAPGDLHRRLGLTDAELDQIRRVLGREPNRTELAMYSVMWSEHCSYKSSKKYLRTLPSSGPKVLVGPGEGAGVIEVDGVAVALRIESHNHPSFVEPVQGAATGIGGVVRDVLSMGARPIALLDSLRFGPLPEIDAPAAEQDPQLALNRFLVEGVVSGISMYGNCIGVPTVGGEIQFDPSYSGNPLVNVMCIGVAPADKLMFSRAQGPGNRVLLLGSATGRDGIGGVSVLASAAFDENASEKRPSVQVGDPFTEKLLIEACLSLIEKGLVVGIQDLGGAGLCCATSESAANAGTGMEVHLPKVPRRQPGMAPFEVMTSESQERMLVVVRPEDVEAALGECDRMGLPAAVIGEVTATGRLEVRDDGSLEASVPAASLGDGPLYDRPAARPSWIKSLAGRDVEIPLPADPADDLLRLMASPNMASKRWAWEQYDHQVMLGTVLGPGHDAALLRIPGAETRIAVTTDGNGRFCFLDPYLGTVHSAAEAARNLSVVGAQPAAVTNCLNFGNPEVPEVMWQFAECVRGLSDACRELGTPVTGGNVSFYNQTGQTPIHPTPVVGMVGLLARDVIPPGAAFHSEGDLIVLVGSTLRELGGSEYLFSVLGRVEGKIPSLDLRLEKATGSVVRQAIAEGLLSAAHDCAAGGAAGTLAECCILGRVGASIEPEPGLPAHVWLFSETASRIVAALPEANLPRLRGLASSAGVALTILGTVGGQTLKINGLLEVSVNELVGAYENGFAGRMEP